MIPILYKSDEVDFYDNGIGPLNDIYDVDVQEQRNGLFTLTASYPVSGRRYKDIEVGRIVLAKPNQNDSPQAFRIIHTELDISGYALTIEADHITYDLTHNLVKSVHLQGNGQNAMTHLQEATVAPHLFRFISDLQHEGDSTLTMVNPMEAIAGTQGSILQIWGGELKRDNRTVSMLSRRGRNNFTSFRLGKNINGLKYTVDTANLVTRIVPSVQRPNGNEHELIIGDIVDSKNVGNYPNYYMQHVDVADNIKIDENDSDDVIKSKINAYAKNWFTQSANSKIDLPEVTVEIDVTSLQDSADYQDKFKNLEAIELTDSVTVYVPEFGVNVQAIVNELHYDPVAERVTSIVIGTSKLSFADANANTLKELGSSINKIRENAVTAIVSANGKNTNYYGTEEPAHPVEGDLWFKAVGDETYLMIFKDGRWQEWVSTKTQDIINKQVDDALASAKEYTDELNDKQASEAAAFQSEANAALSSAAAERKVFSSNAASMASSAASRASSLANSAATYGKTQAASALSQAQSELATAKQELGSEVSKAQSDIIKTNNELSAKVSQTDYDKKTDDLTKKYGQVKATADAVKTDVAKYKESNDGRISANEASIETLNNQITSKVSQTDFNETTGELSGNYTETKQTIKKISNTVTELQAKANAQGQVNQLMNTEFTPDLQGWTFTNNSGTSKPYKSYIDKAIGSTSIGFNTVGDPENTYGATIVQEIPVGSGSNGIAISMRWDVRTVRNDYYTNLWLTFKDAAGVQTGRINRQWSYTTADNRWHEAKWENVALPDGTRTINVSFEVRENTTQYLARPMLVFGSTIGDYVAGNYNNNDRVAALEVDLNGITGLVNDPKKGLSATATLAANGLSVATTAKNNAATAIQTANGTQNTVESFQGDMEDFRSTTTQTAGQVTTEIEDRKSGDKSVRTDMAKLIDQRLIDTKKGYESAISQSADAIMASVSTPNQLLNTEFSPDLEGWTVTNTGGTSKPYRSYIDAAVGSTSVGFSTIDDPANTYGSAIWQTVTVGSSGNGVPISMRWNVRTVRNDNYTNLWLTFFDSTGTQINRINKQWSGPIDNAWHEVKWENISLPDDTRSIKISFEVRENTAQYLARPMLVFGSTIGTYMPGSYSGMNTSTVLELFKDNWALGIANNAGRIISGINGDTSGTVIQGKKLVINSDTTINGKAFIDGSVIKNASIGNAQIGNAAIGSAQIINVDVSKISGNIANFITANVDTLNARVLYGDTGHLGTTDTGRVINKQDNHLQLAARGFYDSTNDRAQLELLGNSDRSISDEMKGSLNYYGNPTDKGHGLGIRLKYNQILAIDEDGGSKMLYLSPYAGGQVRIVSRDLKNYYDIKANKFITSSERKYKSEINEFNDDALELVNGLNIRRYIKNSEDEIGVIADEADERILDKTNTGVDLYSFVSVVAKAVQELSAQVKELQDERSNN